MKIAFFDSGIGGLTVLHQAMRQMPQEDYLYYADMDHVPYGLRSKEEIEAYVEQAVDFIAGQDVKALVVACNTATSVAIQRLRNKYDFPILGMEPAIKPAIQNGNKRVLVTATPVTLREEKLQHLLQQVDKRHIVDLLPLPGLVPLAEAGEFNGEKPVQYLQQALARYRLENYSTLVLGCTHFNFFKDTLHQLLPQGMPIIDGSQGTVNHLYRLLQEKQLLEENMGRVSYYISGRAVTEDLDRYQKLLQRLDEMLKY